MPRSFSMESPTADSARHDDTGFTTVHGRAFHVFITPPAVCSDVLTQYVEELQLVLVMSSDFHTYCIRIENRIFFRH